MRRVREAGPRLCTLGQCGMAGLCVTSARTAQEVWAWQGREGGAERRGVCGDAGCALMTVCIGGTHATSHAVAGCLGTAARICCRPRGPCIPSTLHAGQVARHSPIPTRRHHLGLEGQPLEIVEVGGGNGTLARDVLVSAFARGREPGGLRVPVPNPGEAALDEGHP